MSQLFSMISLLLVTLAFLQHRAEAHGFATIRTELGDRIESRNSASWKRGGQYPDPQGWSTTNSRSRPMYCGGGGQTGGAPRHDTISAAEALAKAKEWGFATHIRKGSKIVLENWITANHGGVGALWYACPADNVNSPQAYSSLNWKQLTPIKDSFPPNKRNGAAFSDKMPDWFGFAGGICNWNYDGGVIQDCDDCQLAYGGPKTVASWQAMKPPTGAPIGTGQKAMRLDIEYQLPSDFQCENAVFSWMYQTPHLCIPRQVRAAGAEEDFWGFCGNRNYLSFQQCSSDWEGEIFTNCMDAEVTDSIGTNLPRPKVSPTPTPAPTASTLVPVPSPTDMPASSLCVPIGDCGAYEWCDQDAYAVWCAEDVPNTCPSPFCRLEAPRTSPTPAPQNSLDTSTDRECVPTNDGAYNNPTVYGPWCATAGSGGTCPGPICKWSASLLAHSAKRVSHKHSFLGTNLMQVEALVGPSRKSFDEL